MTRNLCSNQEETVHLYLDGELSPSERETFIAHLPECATCQARLAELQTLFTELASLAEVVPPAGVTSQVMVNLPAPTPPPRYVTLGRLALAGQIVIGMALMLVAWPMVISAFNGQFPLLQKIAVKRLAAQVVCSGTLNPNCLVSTPPQMIERMRQFGWQLWHTTSNITLSLNNWLTDLVINLGYRMQAQWPPGVEGFNISPDLIIALVVGLSLAWLIGNGVLLRNRSGGTLDWFNFYS